jgi:hypothetical protein
MSHVRGIYDAIGFLPKKEQNKTRRIQGAPIMPYIDGMNKLINSLTYMECLVSKRKEYLGRNGLDGSEGSIYTKTLDGFAQTISSLECHARAFDELGTDTTKLNLYAFTNESRKEHGFAKHKQTGQYRHPTMQQYCQTKGNDEEELIKKSCQCPHSYHTNTFNAYQATHKSSLPSVSVIKEYRDLINFIKPKETSLTAVEAEKIKTDLKKARSMNALTKAAPTQNIRDLYRAKCGFAPCIIHQLDTVLFED